MLITKSTLHPHEDKIWADEISYKNGNAAIKTISIFFKHQHKQFFDKKTGLPKEVLFSWC